MLALGVTSVEPTRLQMDVTNLVSELDTEVSKLQTGRRDRSGRRSDELKTNEREERSDCK